MQINSNFHISRPALRNNNPAFGARLRLNSKELERAFSLELSNQKCYSNLFKTIEKFKNIHPEQTIEGNLLDTGNEKKFLELYNPKTRHLKSFDLTDRGSYTMNTFYKAFEFLTGDESKKFWEDTITKDLFA